MKYLKKYKVVKNFIPAVIVFVLVVGSLKGYTPKTFATKVKEEKYTTSTTNSEQTTNSVNETSSANKSNGTTNTLNNNLTANLNNHPEKIKKVNEPDNATYKDGNFYGEAQGFRGNVQVMVTIKDNKITKIKVVKSHDDKAYFSKATILLSKIVKGQTTNVDTVSGATYSSNGLIGAVRNALDKAQIKKTKDKSNKSTKTKNNKKNNNTKTKNTTKGKIPYKDGVYYGTGEGYKGEIKVAVVIENKKIQYILIMENQDDKAYFTKARGVLKNVLKYQKTNVDTVSGATYSSKGILEAIENALKSAKKKTKDGKSDETETKENPTEEITVVVPETGKGIYKDGTYTLTGICNPDHGEAFEAYTLTATVTIKNDWVTNITDIKGIGSSYIKANDWYLNRAIKGTSKIEGIVKQILTKGNADSIDSVSGATCSSIAIVEIVKKALENAKN